MANSKTLTGKQPQTIEQLEQEATRLDKLGREADQIEAELIVKKKANLAFLKTNATALSAILSAEATRITEGAGATLAWFHHPLYYKLNNRGIPGVMTELSILLKGLAIDNITPEELGELKGLDIDNITPEELGGLKTAFNTVINITNAKNKAEKNDKDVVKEFNPNPELIKKFQSDDTGTLALNLASFARQEHNKEDIVEYYKSGENNPVKTVYEDRLKKAAANIYIGELQEKRLFSTMNNFMLTVFENTNIKLQIEAQHTQRNNYAAQLKSINSAIANLHFKTQTAEHKKVMNDKSATPLDIEAAELRNDYLNLNKEFNDTLNEHGTSLAEMLKNHDKEYIDLPDDQINEINDLYNALENLVFMDDTSSATWNAMGDNATWNATGDNAVGDNVDEDGEKVEGLSGHQSNTLGELTSRINHKLSAPLNPPALSEDGNDLTRYEKSLIAIPGIKDFPEQLQKLKGLMVEGNITALKARKLSLAAKITASKDKFSKFLPENLDITEDQKAIFTKSIPEDAKTAPELRQQIEDMKKSLIGQDSVMSSIKSIQDSDAIITNSNNSKGLLASIKGMFSGKEGSSSLAVGGIGLLIGSMLSKTLRNVVKWTAITAGAAWIGSKLFKGSFLGKLFGQKSPNDTSSTATTSNNTTEATANADVSKGTEGESATTTISRDNAIIQAKKSIADAGARPDDHNICTSQAYDKEALNQTTSLQAFFADATKDSDAIIAKTEEYETKIVSMLNQDVANTIAGTETKCNASDKKRFINNLAATFKNNNTGNTPSLVAKLDSATLK